MAQIPVYQRKPVDISSGGQTQFVDASGLVRGLEVTANAIANRHERLRRADEQMLAVSFDQKFSEMRAQTLEFKGVNARGLTQELQGSEGAMREEFMTGIEDPVTKQNAGIMFQRQYEQQVDWTRDYEMKQEDVYLGQVDINVRGNESKKLNGTQVGDMKTIDQSAHLMTEAAKLRHGPRQWSKGVEVAYKQAVTDQFYGEQITRWYTENPDLAYAWFDKNKEAMKLKVSAKVYDGIAALHKAQYQTAETMRAYKAVRKDYGDNFLQASFDIIDPKNFEKYGIKEHDYKTAHQVSSWLHSQSSMNAALNKQQKLNLADEDGRAFNERTAAIAAMTDLPSRNAAWQNLRNDIRTNKNIEQADREKMIDSIDKANYEEDPKQVRRVKNLIDSGDITRNAQIHAWLGDGIGAKTTELESYLKSKKTADKLGDGENYMKRMRGVFMTAAVERAPASARQKGKRVLMKADVEKFMLRLEATRRQKNLPVSHPDILDLGYALMEKGTQLYQIEDGVEEKVASKWDAFGEYLKFKFMEDPSTDVAVELQMMKDAAGGGDMGKTKTDEQRGEEIAKPVKQEVNAKNAFKIRLQNPRILGADTVEEAADILQGEWEVIYGIGMNDEQRKKLEDTIRQRL